MHGWEPAAEKEQSARNNHGERQRRTGLKGIEQASQTSHIQRPENENTIGRMSTTTYTTTPLHGKTIIRRANHSLNPSRSKGARPQITLQERPAVWTCPSGETHCICYITTPAGQKKDATSRLQHQERPPSLRPTLLILPRIRTRLKTRVQHQKDHYPSQMRT